MGDEQKCVVKYFQGCSRLLRILLYALYKKVKLMNQQEMAVGDLYNIYCQMLDSAGGEEMKYSEFRMGCATFERMGLISFSVKPN